MTVKDMSEKHHPIHDFSDIFLINEINVPPRVQLDNPISDNQNI
jgi:hypothetical protein